MTHALREPGTNGAAKSKPTVQAGLSGHILATKLAPPKAQNLALIAREGLIGRLQAAQALAATVVVAPAGYGKTTLLGQYHATLKAQSVATAWLTLDDSDDDKLLFANHLLSALVSADPRLSGEISVTPDFKIDVDLRSVVVSILNAVTRLESRVVIIIDDLHAIATLDVLGAVSALLHSRCEWVHVVVGSRTIPQIRLAKLRAQGQLCEIGSEDLRFDREEATAFLEGAFGVRLDRAQIDKVYERTEGWPVGLRLISLASPDKGLTEDRLLMPGAAIEDFLRDEVIDHLPPDLAEFVANTGILEEFSSDLCDFVLERTDSAALIEQVEKLQLFISRVGEPGWFRFHQIFSDSIASLQSRREPRRKAHLHEKAAAWFQNSGYPARALRHIFAAGDPQEAAQLLDQVAATLVQSGREGTLLRYCAALPQDMLIDFPELQLERAYTLTLTWQFSEARRILNDVRLALTNSARTTRWAEAGMNLSRITRKLIYCEMQLCILKDEMVKAEPLARQWLQMEGSYSYYEDAVSQTSLIYAQREQFNCQSIAAAGRAREIFVNHENRWGTIWHDCIIGMGYAEIGQLARARTIFGGAFATALTVVGRSNPATAMPALHLAGLAYELGDVDEAARLVDEFLPLSTRIGLVDQLVAGFTTRIRLAALQSVEAALAVVNEGTELAVSREFERLGSTLLADRMKLLASAGDLSELRHVAVVNNLVGQIEPFLPGPGQTTGSAARALAASYLAIAENRLPEAESLLRRWLRYLESCQYYRIGIRFALQLAHTQILMGDPKAAHRTLRLALQMGAPGLFLRVFADANAAVQAQIEQMTIGTVGATEELFDYHRKVVASFAKAGLMPRKPHVDLEAIGGQFEALNDREAEILLMVATGMMNSQIAEETGLTLGTVKWYLQQIYGKLGVNRRSEAVFKARQIGLIS